MSDETSDIKIKHRHTGKVLRVVEGDTLRRAYLGGAELGWADLSGADLRGAFLTEADLRGATLPDGRTITELLADYTDTDGGEDKTDE